MFFHPLLTLSAISECLGDIFMSYVRTASGTVSSWFIARLSGTVTRLTGITMMRRIGLCGNQFGLSVSFHRLTLMNTMRFAPLITFSGKIKLEYLEKCMESFSEREFSFRWGGYVSWCEVTFHSAAEQSVASGQMVLDSDAPSFLPVMKQEVRKREIVFASSAVYLLGDLGKKKCKQTNKQNQFLF